MVSDNTASAVSPEATGGAGTVDEYRFGAVNLVKLLRGDPLPGMPVATMAVGLQRREAGNILDDVVVHSQLDPAALRIEYQVKRTMSPVKSSTAFTDAVHQCLESLTENSADIEAGRLLLGLAAGGPAGPLGELRNLAEAARAHSTVDSFESIVLKP